MIVAAITFGVGQVAYSIVWFFLLFVEVWLMISIFIDIFRSHDMKGWAKALWVILVILLPLIGILLYVVLRGDKIHVHQAQAAAEHKSALDQGSQSPEHPLEQDRGVEPPGRT